MMYEILETPNSNQLLQFLLENYKDIESIEVFLKSNSFSADAVSRAGFDFATNCFLEDVEYYYECSETELRSEPKLIPDLCSSNLYQVFELLIKYGLNPNAVCDDTSIMREVAYVINEYVAADTLALLIEHGGNPDLEILNRSVLSEIDFKVIFDAIEQNNRRSFDALVHCWMVLLGYSQIARDGSYVDIFPERHSDTELEEFKIEDLKEHRNYYFGISTVPGRGESWSLHIFDKRTNWEVMRL